MRILYNICVCAAVVLMLHGAASAGSISTPILFHGDGDQLVCIANNVSAQTQQVTVTIVGISDTITESCELPAGSGERCLVVRNNDNDLRGGYCRITAPGATRTVQRNIRGVLVLAQTAGSILAVVQAQ
jgi:hypothetical protein